jgi:hypothetical protein
MELRLVGLYPGKNVLHLKNNLFPYAAVYGDSVI